MKKPLKSFWRRPHAPPQASRSFFWHRRVIGARHAAQPDGAHETVHRPAEKNLKLLERAWLWIHTTFPERQIYIRSDGRVQFFTFGPSLQATLAGLVLIFLAWVAFATVNVIFKDRIIAAKDHRYQQMQSAYENKVADLQVSYDELNAALVAAEDRFKATADTLQTKQNAIAGFLNRANQAQASVGGATSLMAPSPDSRALTPLAGSAPAVGMPPGMALDDAGSSQLMVMPGPAQPQPRTARPVKSSLLNSGILGGAYRQAASFFQSVREKLDPGPLRDMAAVYTRHPGLHALVTQTKRVSHIGDNETQLMARTETTLDQDVGALRNMVRRAGINPDSLARKISSGEGGPEIPLDQVRIEGISDPEFTRAYLSAAAVLDQLNGLSVVMAHVPLTAPVSSASFDKSSGFGPRVDPFTRRYAFHSGIDFAGPWGSVVHATAPGVVVFAGNRGGYGNMVEIDHGYGIHTRYGHLSTIGVRMGVAVDKGANLGRVGSTGRSTGPHVHYEVWYDDVARNPTNFIEAGRHVL